MKLASLVLAFCASTAVAQVGNRVSLELGTVTVWLGMDKASAKQQIEAAGMLFHEADTKHGQGEVVDTHSSRVFTLKFDSNRLVFADRNWLRDDAQSLLSVMDALASLVDKGATRCTILSHQMHDTTCPNHRPQHENESRHHRLWTAGDYSDVRFLDLWHGSIIF